MNTKQKCKPGDLIFDAGHWQAGLAAGVLVTLYPSEANPQVAIFKLLHEPGRFAASTSYEPLSPANMGEAFGNDEGIDREGFYAGVSEHHRRGSLTAEQCEQLAEWYGELQR